MGRLCSLCEDPNAGRLVVMSHTDYEKSLLCKDCFRKWLNG